MSARLSNLERFWVATAPCVSVDADRGFRLRELWAALEDWSAYGASVPLVLGGDQEVAQYYAPSLSALQLFAAAPTGAAAASGRSADRPRLLFECFERAPPFVRKPLSDTLAELKAANGGVTLGTLSTANLHARSFLAICWQPICRIPLGRVFREISTSFITYHRLGVGAADFDVPDSCSPAARAALQERSAGNTSAALLPAFGLLSLKLDADQWLEGGDARFKAELAAACTRWMESSADGTRHSDYEFYTATSTGSA